MSCQTLALTLLLHAVDDAMGQVRIDQYNIVPKDTKKGEGKRLKDNAFDFFFSKESEPYCQFWCDMAGEPLSRFREKLQGLGI